MHIKKVDRWWVIYYKKRNLLIVDLFLDNALFRGLQLLKK
jgi:hypothetical protein